MKKNRFCFDGQLHIPSYRVEETVKLAIARNLDALIFTDYGCTDTFHFLAENSDLDGRRLLNERMFGIERINNKVLKLLSEIGDLYVIRGEEVMTRNGHILLWGLQEPINNGLGIDDTLKDAYFQGAVAVFSHLLNRMFNGSGREVFDTVHSNFVGSPLGVEKNGQIPETRDANREIEVLAKQYGVACFGTSDIHGRYLFEHRKIGLRYYSSVPIGMIEPSNLVESLRCIMLNTPEVVQIDGKANKAYESWLWNAQSIMLNGVPKIRTLFDGIRSRNK